MHCELIWTNNDVSYDDQNGPEQEQSLISANQTTTLINVLPQLKQIFDH